MTRGLSSSQEGPNVSARENAYPVWTELLSNACSEGSCVNPFESARCSLELALTSIMANTDSVLLREVLRRHSWACDGFTRTPSINALLRDLECV